MAGLGTSALEARHTGRDVYVHEGLILLHYENRLMWIEGPKEPLILVHRVFGSGWSLTTIGHRSILKPDRGNVPAPLGTVLVSWKVCPGRVPEFVELVPVGLGNNTTQVVGLIALAVPTDLHNRLLKLGFQMYAFNDLLPNDL